jgi:hypothetical protein
MGNDLRRADAGARYSCPCDRPLGGSFRRDRNHAATRAGPLDDDVSPRALDEGHDLGPLGRRDCELVERLCPVVHERAHSPGVMRRCRCELSMSLPVYFCGPPAAQRSISVTRYLKPAGGTLWCASSTKGLALSRGSAITRSMRSSTTVAML